MLSWKPSKSWTARMFSFKSTEKILLTGGKRCLVLSCVCEGGFLRPVGNPEVLPTPAVEEALCRKPLMPHLSFLFSHNFGGLLTKLCC